MSDEWIEQVKSRIEFLKEMKAADRLSVCNSLMDCWLSIQASQEGWKVWLQNVQLLDKLTDETLRKFLKEYQKEAVAFLEFDVVVTDEMKKLFPREEIGDNKKDAKVGVV